MMMIWYNTKWFDLQGCMRISSGDGFFPLTQMTLGWAQDRQAASKTSNPECCLQHVASHMESAKPSLACGHLTNKKHYFLANCQGHAGNLYLLILTWVDVDVWHTIT